MTRTDFFMNLLQSCEYTDMYTLQVVPLVGFHRPKSHYGYMCIPIAQNPVYHTRCVGQCHPKTSIVKKCAWSFATAQVVNWLVDKLTTEHWSDPEMTGAFAQS